MTIDAFVEAIFSKDVVSIDPSNSIVGRSIEGMRC